MTAPGSLQQIEAGWLKVHLWWYYQGASAASPLDDLDPRSSHLVHALETLLEPSAMSEVLRIAWYRFRSTLRRRWRGYVSVVLLIGLLGGVAMASIAGGRRTQSSYPTFFTSTNPSNLTISAFATNGDSTGTAKLTSEFAHLADVQRVRTLLAPTIEPLATNGAPRLTASNNLLSAGSLDGLLLNQDRVTVVEGRRPDRNRADEVMMTANAAQQLGVHLGQVVPLGFYTHAQTE